MTSTDSATIAYPFNRSAEAHAEGCKAATRRVNKVETETVTVKLSTIAAMIANPDEGDLKIHTCLQGLL